MDTLTADQAARLTLERLEQAAAFHDVRAATFFDAQEAAYQRGRAAGIRYAMTEVRLWLEEPAPQPDRPPACTCIEGNDALCATSAVVNCPVHGNAAQADREQEGAS